DAVATVDALPRVGRLLDEGVKVARVVRVGATDGDELLVDVDDLLSLHARLGVAREQRVARLGLRRVAESNAVPTVSTEPNVARRREQPLGEHARVEVLVLPRGERKDQLYGARQVCPFTSRRGHSRSK